MGVRVSMIDEYSSFVTYSHRADHLCPILTGQFFCVLLSQGKSFVSYSRRAKILCPILTGQIICVLFVAFSVFGMEYA